MKVKTSENKAQVFFSVLFPKKGLIKKAAWKERETLRPKKRVDFFYSPQPFLSIWPWMEWFFIMKWRRPKQSRSKQNGVKVKVIEPKTYRYRFCKAIYNFLFKV